MKLRGVVLGLVLGMALAGCQAEEQALLLSRQAEVAAAAGGQGGAGQDGTGPDGTGPDGTGQPAGRRVLVHASGFRQSPYADIRPAGDSTRQPGSKLWHSSPGSSVW